MSDLNKPSLRIDWFDGTVIEDNRQTPVQNCDENITDREQAHQTAEVEKKPIGFKKLYELSLSKDPILKVELANRPGFWRLLDTELKGDYIVLIVKVLLKIYRNLSPGEKNKIVHLLRMKFEKSHFLITLNDYVSGLPNVRITEKKTNLQLWNDVQTFYDDVLNLCDYIFNFGTNSSTFLHDLYNLLKATEISAVGVQIEHSEVISEGFFIKIKELMSNILNHIQVPEKTEKQLHTNNNPDVNSFRKMNIFPNYNDLVKGDIANIKPNIINGAYSSVEDYLDLQFKLLREDCFGPMREGICKFMENTEKRSQFHRIYPKVLIIRTYVGNTKVGHLVDIAYNERQQNGRVDSKNYTRNKRFMFGSLLLFTNDAFRNIYCATVLDSNLNLLSQGYLAVQFQSPISSSTFCRPFLMVESEVFFEPYHRVLKVLQNCGPTDLPMTKYIVDVQSRTEPPAYLSKRTIYTIKNLKSFKEISFPVLNSKEWPAAECFGLDEAQLAAYTLALTREFAVIQGPPGTGKTFIGTKIASTLLENLSLEGTPMLIISYTNHALDQFLEGILNVTKNVIRLGGQSKSKRLESYTLNNIRTKVKSKYYHLYIKKRNELGELFNKMTEIQNEIEKCEKELVSYKHIKPYLMIQNKLHELRSDKEDPVLEWIFGHLDSNLGANTDEKCDISYELVDTDNQLEDTELAPVDDKIDTCFSTDGAIKEIEYMKNSINHLNDITNNDLESQKMKEQFINQINKLTQRLEFFKTHIILHENIGLPTRKNNEPIKDLYEFNPDTRWKVYSHCVRKVKLGLMQKIYKLLEQQNACSNELEELSTIIDSDAMRTARVVGVTTTVAARRHQLLKTLASPIVIVEEAAEVLEAHILASLTNSCQHLILIGDHKQLRPTAAHYKLAKHYNLEVSLFERMIRNGIHSCTLLTQHRMRPEFVKLLVPAIYERLDCHPKVFSYPAVRGMKDPLYFYNHSVPENCEGSEDNWSHKNKHEAEWCVSLASYLRRVGYTSQDIVVLTAYNGQAALIKELSKKHVILDKIKITVVDSYQGEESRIVILSLVRSNTTGTIGFLNAANRICVALSRAREGLYIFGNMDFLETASPIWKTIHKKLTEQDAIGRSLVLRCENHKDNMISVNNPEALEDILKGKCLKTCFSSNT